jgi:hypothetical protein
MLSHQILIDSLSRQLLLKLQAHEQVSHAGSIGRLVEVGIFAVQNRLYDLSGRRLFDG